MFATSLDLMGAEPEQKLYNTQPESTALSRAEQALKGFHLPPGFQATVFASEPEVQQPIGMTTDSKGRLWVVENYTYAEGAVNFATNLYDRVVIFDDKDNDGRFDDRKVFWDRGQKMTSVAVGFGGVYALCPPRLLFIPDQNGDDIPDGEPEVLLDGWEDNWVRHNIANGLKWGPDGWLYGRHGIQSTSFIGKPGTAKSERTMLNCSIWRYHPATRAFEVVARGTTNPWGHDWDDHGQLFFINTVIGHLWHVLPGAYYRRMYGEHANPYLYELIDQTADHVHWDTKEEWLDIRKLGVTATTSERGGGHAHSGMMIYLGNNWPSEYRGSMFTVNLHGRRLNRDRLERQGAGYLGLHAKDFMTLEDPWFRGIDLLSGPDGGVFLSDWSDIGECHEQDGVHRTSGRIYKIIYGQPKTPAFKDLSQLSNAELVKLQLDPNEWFVRQARLVLQERAARGADMKEVQNSLRQLFRAQIEPRAKLRALWSLYVIGGAEASWLKELLKNSNEHIRVWAIQLLIDQKEPSPDLIAEFTRMSKQDESGLVLSFLASALQKMPVEQRWAIAEGLVSHSAFADDRQLPLMVWYGIEPGVSQDPARSVALIASSKYPKVRQFASRRITEDLEANIAAVNELISRTSEFDPTAQKDVLQGMSQALRGWHKASPPTSWSSASTKFTQSKDEDVRKLAKELAVVFGDGRAADELREIVANDDNDLNMRRRALQSLVQSRAPNLLPLLQGLFKEMEISPDAVRGLATLGYPETPSVLLKAYPSLRYPARMEAINGMSSRPAFALALLNAVKTNLVQRQDVGAFQIRQMRSFNQPEVTAMIDQLWPEMVGLSAEKQQLMSRYQAQLTGSRLTSADLSNGRRLFEQSCANCHMLFGRGAKIGPDLTGSDRTNLAYLLDNILDPSAIVPGDYRVSVVTLKDGRIINGVVSGKTDRRMRLQTITEQLSVDLLEVESITESQLSMMPEGLLEGLSDNDVRDLVAYLMSPRQVPLKGKE